MSGYNIIIIDGFCIPLHIPSVQIINLIWYIHYSVMIIIAVANTHRFIYELWGHGESYDDLKKSLLQTPEYVRVSIIV